MTILTGFFYPLMITGIGQVFFPHKANGSFIMKDGKIIGSELIGQKFDSSIYFWSRPSATSYNAIPSGGSNYGPTSDTLRKLSGLRKTAFLTMNFLTDTTHVPKEMIFASGSGLDPHISPASALLQVERVASNRKFDTERTQKLIGTIKSMTEKRQFSILGEPVINVLKLNVELDRIAKNNQ